MLSFCEYDISKKGDQLMKEPLYKKNSIYEL